MEACRELNPTQDVEAVLVRVRPTGSLPVGGAASAVSIVRSTVLRRPGQVRAWSDEHARLFVSWKQYS